MPPQATARNLSSLCVTTRLPAGEGAFSPAGRPVV